MPEATEVVDLLIHARWVAPVEPNLLLEHHAVAVRNGRIVALLPSVDAKQCYRAKETVELGEHLLIPGLINLHTHAAMSLMRGLADDLPLMTWLREHIWPAEAVHVSHKFVHDGTLLACAEMLKGGITCFNDMYFFPGATAEAAAEAGIRAMIGIFVIDFPSAYASDSEDYLNKGLAVRDHWQDNPLIDFCLAPHAPYTVSDHTFDQVQTLSAQLDVPIHIHIHETLDELREHQFHYGCRPLQRMASLGLLSPQFLAVHGVHLDRQDIDLLAQHACHIAHCPTSNLKLASGIAPVDLLFQAGINVGLGTDGAASNNRLDMLQEMRLASLLAKGRSGDASCLPAHQALHISTLGNAQALGLEKEIGSIRIGKAADICAIELGKLETTPCYDPVSHLIYCADRSNVSHVWVAGRCCVFNKTLVSMDEAGLKNSGRLWQNRLGSRPRS